MKCTIFFINNTEFLKAVIIIVMKNQISTIKLKLIIIIVIIVFTFVDRVDKFVNNTEFLKAVIIVIIKKD